MRKRLDEAKGLTLTDYNEKIGLPLWRKEAAEPQANLETFIERGSLTHIIDRLRDNPKVHIMHNTDDILINRKAIEEIKETLRDRVILYPYGGHLGNLWYPENKKDDLKILRSAPAVQVERER